MEPSAEILERRFAAQLLTGPPAHSAEAVVERLLAVQAQDARGARLTIRSRSAGLSAADSTAWLRRVTGMTAPQRVDEVQCSDRPARQPGGS